MRVNHESQSLRRKLPFPIALLFVVGSGIALAACASGSGIDKRQVRQDAAARCASAQDKTGCQQAQSRRLVDEGYISICRAKGLADHSPAMKRCRGELAYADCVRTISDYQGYTAQMNPRGPWEAPPSAVCKSHLVAD
ncbi:hypothetical protein [Labrys neptuniae]